MTYDDYLLKLDEMLGEFDKQQNECKSVDTLLNAADINIGKMVMKEEHLAESLSFNRKKAKVVELDAFSKTKTALRKIRQDLFVARIERAQCLKKKAESYTMLLTLDNKIKAFKEQEQAFGKVIQYDFRGNQRINRTG